MDPFLLILADDHTLFRQGLKRLVEMSAGLKVAGEAGDGRELLGLLDIMTPQMVILDISMPNLNGIGAIREIKMKYPDVKILVLTMHKDEAYLHHALSAGADGYLLKEDADQDLFSAVECIRQGKVYLSSRLTDQK